MTDWAKLTVAKLKEACAERDVSIVGLKLKQQFIDKLTEWESEQSVQPGAEENLKSEEAKEEADKHEAKDTTDPAIENGQRNIVDDQDQESQDVEETNGITSEESNAKQEKTAEDKSEAIEAATKPSPDEQIEPPVAEIAATKDHVAATEDFDQEGTAPTIRTSNQNVDIEVADTPEQPLLLPKPPQENAPPPSPIPAIGPLPPAPTGNSTRSSSAVPLSEVHEDSRKRKRRSVTPPPKEEEVALKKAKVNEGLPVSRTAGAKEEQQAAIDGAGVDADAGPLAHGLPVAEDTVDLDRVRPANRSPSPENDRHVEPALHPATSALYIRNFKRPLRALDLQAHIASLARSREDLPDSKPIQFFYLDVIRTHAFVRLDSITAASRVRSSLHDTRWPNEPTRDFLWIDFIPDDKAEAWANQEADSSAGSGFGGGRGGPQKRWEVVYDSTPDGVKAVLQDASAMRRDSQQQQARQQRPSISSNHKISASIEPAAPSVHPDRATLLPRDRDYPDRRHNIPSAEDHHPPQRRPAHAERGFAALDELFSSTRTTKPKLYFNPVTSEIAEARLDMIKRLRVGHQDMGRSGDEGMKRYTFEVDRGRQEWVDKGPEFGFGRKGRERLVGDNGAARPPRGGGNGGGYRGGGGGGGRGRGGGGSGIQSPGRGGAGGGSSKPYADWDAPPPPGGRRGGDSWRGSTR